MTQFFWFHVSLDFNAIFPVRKPLPPMEAWPGLMSELGPATPKLIERFRPSWRVQEWTAEPSRFSKPTLPIIDVVGPGGIALSLAPTAASLCHCSRWRLFTGDVEMQLLLRQTCFEIGQLFGADRVIYVHEFVAGVLDGADFTKNERELTEHFGPPAASLASFGPDFGKGCWYMEIFGSLPLRSPGVPM